MFPKFIQVGLYSGGGGGGVYTGGFIFGMLIGFHIWGAYILGGAYIRREGVLTGFYGI